MEIEQTLEPGLSFEKVWAALMENREQMKETDRRMQETDRKLQELAEESKKLDKRMGDIHNSIGELMEVLIAAHLWEKFGGYNYNFKRAYPRVLVYSDDHRLVSEIDLLLSNTEWVMPVEVKRSVNRGDIEHHLRRMELVKKYPPAEAKGKRMVAAIAGGFVPEDVREAAFGEGIFVLELAGESVTICPPPEGFRPREW